MFCKIFSFYRKQDKAFTLLEIAVYLSLFAAIILVLYPTIDNLIAYLNSWQAYQDLLSDFRRISAELQRRALEAANITLLASPPGVAFSLSEITISYYATNSAIYRQDPAGTIILTSTSTLANWNVYQKEGVFQAEFILQDKTGRVFFQATSSFGKLVP